MITVFRNLECEMVRRNITRKDLALCVGRSYNTISEKLRGKFPLTYNEAIKIHKTFFPECDILYLFETNEISDNKKKCVNRKEENN